MRILITIMILWSSTMAFGQEIWQLSPWAPDSSYVIGAMNSGEPTWVKVDSLGLADSIYLTGDDIMLRDGSGVVHLPTANSTTKGLLSSTDWNRFNNKLDATTTFGPDVTGTYNNLRGKYMQWNADLGLDANTFSSGKFTFRYVNAGVPTPGNVYGLLEVPRVGSTSNWQIGSRITDNLLYFRNNNATTGTWQQIFSTLNLPNGLKYGDDLSLDFNTNPSNNTQAIRYAYANTNSPDGTAFDGIDIRRNNIYGWQIAKNGTSALYVRGRTTSTWDNWEIIPTLSTGTATSLYGLSATNKLVPLGLTGLTISGGNLVAAAPSTEYLDPYIISSDTVGFILKNVMDTVQFIGVAGVTGESTTVSDSPTINMTLTGTNISSEVIDGSITPTKLSQTYLITEVDGSTTNEIQTLSIAGNNLTISGAGGNTVTLPSGGGSSEWASLHYGSLAANTQTLTSSVWNTINFTGSSESNASVLDANHTNDEIEFVVAGTYRVDYRVSFIANADALIYSGIYSSASSSVDGNTQMESDTDSGYKHTIMQHSYIKTAVAGEKIKLQVQPLIAHTSVAIYSNFIVTKL